MTTNNVINANSSTPLPIINGGTAVNSVTTTPTATAFAGWDANKNLSGNNLLPGFTTTASSGGTLVLTVSSTQTQEITGTLTHTIQMPVASTVQPGHPFKIINNSSGSVTLTSSGGNTILTMAANTTAFVNCVINSGTTAASWNASYVFDNGAGVLSITGTANQVNASASTGAVTLSTPQDIGTGSTPTFAGMNLTNPYITGAGGLHSIQVFTTGTGATYTKPANVTSIYVEVIGGGGGGGGSTGGASSLSAGGGGGAGGYASLWVPSAASTYTYTVGGGGAGGLAGANTGTTGGTTSFSASTLQATGGSGGLGMGAIANTTSSCVYGGQGGVGSNGSINVKGQGGTSGIALMGNGVNGGIGGSSRYGGGSNINVGGAGNYGSGGAGSTSVGSSTAGGAGAGGLIIVWEFA